MKGSYVVPPPVIPRREIIRRAEQLIDGYAREVGLDWLRIGVSFDHVYDHWMYRHFRIDLVEDDDLGHDDEGAKIWGKFLPGDRLAYIDRSLKNDPRRAFTCWHEVGGHGVLQGDWLRMHESRLRNREIITTEASLQVEMSEALEWQANLFASHAGIPTCVLHYQLNRLLGIERPVRFIGKSWYTLVVGRRTHRHFCETFDQLCLWMAFYVKPFFGGMSQEAISYRISGTRFAVDCTKRRFEVLRRARTPALAAS